MIMENIRIKCDRQFPEAKLDTFHQEKIKIIFDQYLNVSIAYNINMRNIKISF